nr:unnamed protein product [Digitaria exilis]
MATSPPQNPSSGDPSDASSLTAAALDAPARAWRSLVARLPPLPDSSGLLAAVANLQRRYFGVRPRRRRRRAALPLPLRPAAAHSARFTYVLSYIFYFRIAGDMPKAFAILEEVVQHTLTNLHSIHKSLLFWQAKAEVHSEVERCREGLTANSDKSLHTLFIVLNTTFSKLEVSLRNAGEVYHTYGQDELFTLDGNSYELFEKLPEVDVESQEWTEELSTDGISLIYQNLQKLDSFLSSQIISIRDELFETFKQRDKGVMENQEVQLTEDSLRRMLVAFCEKAEARKLPEDSSVQAMLEILAKRYEKELIHPIQNLFTGELARAMLIQIQKLKLDLESGLLEMDQILRANAINFAVLAALPAFGLSLLLLMLLRTWIQRDHGAEGRGNIARCQRRLLLVDVERRLMEFQYYRDNGMEEEALCKFGLVLYTLDRLCKAVESHAKETGEWLSLREDIFDLAKLDMGTTDKMVVVSRLKWMYNCLLPFSSSRLPRL